MQTWRLIAKRSVAQFGLLATVCTVALALSGVLVGTSGYLDLTATTATRSALTEANPTASALQVQTNLSGKPATQNRAMHRLLGTLFGAAPLNVYRTVRHYPRDVSRGGKPIQGPNGTASVIIGSDVQLARHAKLVAGSWPGTTAVTPHQPAPAALQADAAKALDLSVGDEIVVGNADNTRRVKIVATWLPKQPQNPLWFGDQAVISGYTADTGNGDGGFGPLILAEANLTELGTLPVVNWTIVPNTQAITASGLDGLATASAHLKKSVTVSKTVNHGGVVMLGSLRSTVTSIQNGLGAVRGVTPVAVLIAALIGLIALIQLASLLVADRRPETALLRSRGASVRLLTWAAVAEASVVAVIGAAIGCLGAALVLRLLPAGAALASVPWGYAVAVAAVAILVFGFAAWRDARIPPNRERVDDSGRARTAATISVAVLAIAAAAVSTWQSLLYGSPITVAADGTRSLNVLVVLAPALGLVAIAMILLVLFGPITSWFQAIASHSHRLQPVYSARQTARRLGAYAVCVLLIGLSVGSATLASAYDGSWSTLSTHASQLRAGTDERVDLSSALAAADASPTSAAPYRKLNGVSQAAAALSTSINIGSDDTGQLTALPSSSIESVMTDVGGTLDLKPAAAALHDKKPPGVALPAGATKLSVTRSVTMSNLQTIITDNGVVTSTPKPLRDVESGIVKVSLWLEDSSGAIVTLPLKPVDLTGTKTTTGTVSVDLPHSDSGWRLAAMDISCTSFQFGAQCTTTVTGLATADASATSRPVEFNGNAWHAQISLGSFGSSGENSASSFSIGLTPEMGGTDGIRVMPQQGSSTAGAYYAAPAPPIPIVVNQALADALALKVGKTLDFVFSDGGGKIAGTVKAIVPMIPGDHATFGVLTDLPRLNDYLLRTSTVVPKANQIWLATDRPHPAAAKRIAGTSASVATASPTAQQAFGEAGVRALWLGSIGSLLLAAIAVGAVTLSLARSRREEVTVLRAIGVSARAQGRARALEILGVCAIALLFGVIAGAGVAVLDVLNLARSVVPDAPAALPVSLRFALATGIGLVVLDAVALTATGLTYAARVRRQARTTNDRLETR